MRAIVQFNCSPNPVIPSLSRNGKEISLPKTVPLITVSYSSSSTRGWELNLLMSSFTVHNPFSPPSDTVSHKNPEGRTPPVSQLQVLITTEQLTQFPSPVTRTMMTRLITMKSDGEEQVNGEDDDNSMEAHPWPVRQLQIGDCPWK